MIKSRGSRSQYVLRALVTVASCLLLTPVVARAQQIGGEVADSTGGVLPGVIVEARSPVLIEGVRTAVTDGSGQYLIIALQPGTYSVTYSLPGFDTLVREGIALSLGFTATIDVGLSVGDISETVTVTGASPTVDIQNVRQSRVVSREVIETIPTGKSFQSYALLVPGMQGSESVGTPVSQDSGGLVVQSYQTLAIHGGRLLDMETSINNLSVSSTQSPGFAQGFVPDGNYQEMAVEYAAHSAAVQYGGVRINAIPREGSNVFSGSFFGTVSRPELQADNLGADQRARGLEFPIILDQVWLVNPSVGGPIVRDRLWFFAGHTTQVADLFPGNTFLSTNTDNFVFVPDLSRPSLDANKQSDTSFHLTWQASSRDKVKMNYSWNTVDKPNSLPR